MKTMYDVSEKFDAAYKELTGLLYQQEQIETALLSAQTDLTNSRSRVILEVDAKTLGVNEAQREARIAQITAHQRQEVQNLESRRVSLRFRVEIARLEVDHARHDLRLLEVAAALPSTRLAA